MSIVKLYCFIYRSVYSVLSVLIASDLYSKSSTLPLIIKGRSSLLLSWISGWLHCGLSSVSLPSVRRRARGTLSSPLPHKRELAARFRLLQHRETALLSKINYLHSEIWREREARFVVEKCYNEKLRQNEIDLDFMEDECEKLKTEIKQLQDDNTILKGIAEQNFKVSSTELPVINSPLAVPFCSFSDPIQSPSRPIFHSSPVVAEGAFTAESSDSNSADDEDEDTMKLSLVSFYADLVKNDPYMASLICGDETTQLPSYVVGLISRLVEAFTSECPTCTILIDLDDTAAKHDLSADQMLRIITFTIMLYMERKHVLERSREAGLDAVVQNYMHLFANFLESPSQQQSVLATLDLFLTSSLLRSRSMLKTIMSFYSAEILDPEAIIGWWLTSRPRLISSRCLEQQEIGRVVGETVGPLVEYLKKRLDEDDEDDDESLYSEYSEESDNEHEMLTNEQAKVASNGAPVSNVRDTMRNASLFESIGICSASYNTQPDLKSQRRPSFGFINAALMSVSDETSSVSSTDSGQPKTGSDFEPSFEKESTTSIMSSAFISCKSFRLGNTTPAYCSTQKLEPSEMPVDSSMCKRVTFSVAP